MSNLWIYLLVFVLAATPMFEVFTVVPLGILAGLPSFPVSIVAFLGNALTVFLLIVFIERLKLWWKKKERGNRRGRKRLQT
ncbi:small multi-drug export protein [Aneurinibacillus thermoaerophilus]|uniref:small multi-drug export protein n=1 Tax=Aneurinibacillus thermoaerophilus TaxID=143495 RepID=UPI001FEB0466|nr:small multi-drug export protein [Aneurinibacillus thermoaerophilus]MED0757693.1 small multi-drug export protein [Aneurinibacillus thermoaerophilus]MED0762170.1 small multi-drug export protein [Aneurinibacillus thermoaerophilus]